MVYKGPAPPLIPEIEETTALPETRNDTTSDAPDITQQPEEPQQPPSPPPPEPEPEPEIEPPPVVEEPAVTAPAALKEDKTDTKRLFGLAHQKSYAYGAQDDYNQRYPPDTQGAELSANARIWRVYLDETELNDRDMVEAWKDAMDVLLVFAGLFSAVVTTFVVQTSQQLQVDYGQMSASLLTELVALQRASLEGTSPLAVPHSELNYFSTPTFGAPDKWINGLWFASLSLSLVVALSGVLIKQWIQHYVSFISGSAKERARVHHFRYLGLQRWNVPAIIGMLPFLLHTALFLFLTGLVVFIHTLDNGIAGGVGAIGVAAILLYIGFTSLPLFYPQCPYRTPVIEHTRSVASFVIYASHRILFPFTHRILPSLLSQYRQILRINPITWLDDWCQEILETDVPRYSLKPLKVFEFKAAYESQDEITSEIIHWLVSSSSNPSAKALALQAIGGLWNGFTWLDHLLGVGSPVRDELLREADEQEKLASEASTVDRDAFYGSPLFFSFERLLRATVFVPQYKRAVHIVINTPPVLDPSALSTDSGRAFATYVMRECWILSTASDIWFWLEFSAGEIAEKLPLVWHTWSKILDILPPYALPYFNIVDTYNAHSKLLHPLVLGTTSVETWAAVLPVAAKVLRLEDDLEEEELEELLYFPSHLELMTKQELFFKKLGFVTLLLKRLVAECDNNPDLVTSADPVAFIVLDICFGLANQDYNWDYAHLVAAVAARLADQPFFINQWWNYATYHKLFDLFIWCQIYCARASQPFALMSRDFLLRCFQSQLVTHSLLEAMAAARYDPSGTGRRAVGLQVDQILRILESEMSSQEVTHNIFISFTELCRTSSEQAVGPVEGGKQWVSPLQPLVGWMLKELILSEERGVVEEGIKTFSSMLTDSTQPDWFVMACSGFLFYREEVSDQRRRVRVVLRGDEGTALLQLALHHKDNPDILPIWRHFLSFITTTSAQVRIHDWEKNEWYKKDYEDYLHLVDFVNNLVTILGFSNTEFVMAEMDATYVPDPDHSEKRNVRRNSGPQNQDQDDGAVTGGVNPRSRMALFRKLLPWRTSDETILNQQEIGLESQSEKISHSESQKPEKASLSEKSEKASLSEKSEKSARSSIEKTPISQTS